MKKLILFIVLALSLAANAQSDSTLISPKTDEVLAKILDKAMIAAEKTGEFVIEQAPLLLKEFYMWHIASDIFFIILGILLILAAIYSPLLYLDKNSTYTGYRDNVDYDFCYLGKYGNTDGAMVPIAIFGSIGSIGGLILLTTNLYDLIFLYFAPKLYLIEYFTNKL